MMYAGPCCRCGTELYWHEGRLISRVPVEVCLCRLREEEDDMKPLQYYCPKCGDLFSYSCKCPDCGCKVIKRGEEGKGLMEYANYLNKQYAEKLAVGEVGK